MMPRGRSRGGALRSAAVGFVEHAWGTRRRGAAAPRYVSDLRPIPADWEAARGIVTPRYDMGEGHPPVASCPPVWPAAMGAHR